MGPQRLLHAACAATASVVIACHLTKAWLGKRRAPKAHSCIASSADGGVVSLIARPCQPIHQRRYHGDVSVGAFGPFVFGAAAARARVPLTQSLSQVGVTEVRVSHDRVSTQTGALLDSLPLFAFAHLFPLLLSQVTLFAVFFFILVLNLAYMLMGIGQYTFEPGNLPRFRAHLNAVVFSRFALIALLASFVALMRCDPVGAEEEVRSIEPSLTHVILALRILVYLTLVSEAHALRLVRPPSAAGQ